MKSAFHVPVLWGGHEQVRRALALRQVEVTHRGNMRRKYRVKDITSRPLQELT